MSLASRRGATLAELLVAITLAAIVLGVASATVLRQRRSADGQLAGERVESQARAALDELQAVLADVSPAAGDLASGEARDTAMQIRAVVGSGVACDSGVGQVTFAAEDTTDNRAGGLAVAPRIGDTLWWHPPDSAQWIARRVAVVSTVAASCTAMGGNPQPLLRLAFATLDSVPSGAPLRLTRQARYSFYRGGDGSWQLGVSEWSDVLHAFAPPQPVAGPFVLVASGGVRTGFRYFDAAANALPAAGQGIDVTKVARIRVTVAEPPVVGSSAGTYRDSVDMALGHGP